jgi:uncharacterized membrane protein
MSKFVVIVFPNETLAYEGTAVLKALHSKGSLTLYGMAVVAKDAAGTFSVKDAADASPVGTAVGTFVGGLFGVIGGPIGVIAGAAGGSVLGSLMDLCNYGVGEDFVAKVSKELAPGKSAVIAEIVENWTSPLDTRMEALGGTVLRTWRGDFEDERMAKDVAERKADLEELRSEYAHASAEAKKRLKAKLDQAKADLKRTEERVQAKIDALGREVNVKIAVLEKQIAQARADAKEKITQRVAALRADYETRSAKLKAAWALTKEALAA